MLHNTKPCDNPIKCPGLGEAQSPSTCARISRSSYQWHPANVLTNCRRLKQQCLCYRQQYCYLFSYLLSPSSEVQYSYSMGFLYFSKCCMGKRFCIVNLHVSILSCVSIKEQIARRPATFQCFEALGHLPTDDTCWEAIGGEPPRTCDLSCCCYTMFHSLLFVKSFHECALASAIPLSASCFTW